jgi:cyclopropane fatty-acyl-phospholipid synthase-like methyltransferase
MAVLLETPRAGAARLPAPPSGRPRSRARLPGQLHSRARDAAAVRHQYDVGNDLYRLFLDRDLVYSCGYFADRDRGVPVTDRAVLDRAQHRKLELICRKLALRPGERFLDVGCGWGALVIHAAREHGTRAVGVTLSEQQAVLARQRVTTRVWKAASGSTCVTTATWRSASTASLRSAWWSTWGPASSRPTPGTLEDGSAGARRWRRSEA